MNLSIVVPRYKTPERVVSRALRSLEETSKINGYLHEIVLIDSSPEPLSSAVLEGITHLQYCHFDRRMFVGEARNVGIARSQYDNIAFFDCDCIRSESWAPSLIEFDSQNPNWMILTGPVRYESNQPDFDLAFHLWEFQEFFSDKGHQARFAVGCNSVFKRAVFDRFGGYHSDWQNIEDFEFSLRVRHKSNGAVKVHFHPGLSIIHQQHLTIREDILSKTHSMGYWRGYHDIDLAPSGALSNRFYFGCILRVPTFFSIGFLFLNHVIRRGIYSGVVWRAIHHLVAISKVWGVGFLAGWKKRNSLSSGKPLS